MRKESWIETAVRPDVVQRALRVAILVGTILALINHGDSILAMTADTLVIAKILLTYFVPYCVSTWSSVQMARSKS